MSQYTDDADNVLIPSTLTMDSATNPGFCRRTTEGTIIILARFLFRSPQSFGRASTLMM
jgi:hypothetical protein